MILTSLGTMAVALTIAAFWLQRMVLAIGSAFAWMVFAADAYIVSGGDATTAAYWVFWFGIAMTIAMALEAVVTQRSAKKIKEEETALPYDNGNTHPIDKLRKKHGLSPSKARESKERKRKARDIEF